MAEATTSRHESNYIKIAMVVLRVSPRAVRLQFDKEFRPDRLQSILNRNILHLTNLKMKKRITQPQWNLLFPTTGKQPSSKDFDITLMICLLRNLMPIDIMDNRLPSAADTSLRADLSRIKYYRNFIVHCNSALVDDTDFESYWNDVTPAILRLGGNSLKVECDDWYGRNLDADQRDDGLKCIKAEKRLALVEEELQEQSKELQEQSKELQEQSKELAEQSKELIELKQEQSNPVPRNIRELFTRKIESWKKDNFFKTSAVATILDEVRNKSFVVITGPSGIGKSTIVKLVALQLQRTDDYHILPVMCPQDIEKYLDPNIKQIYIIDDICGKFSVDQSMINSWENVHSQILKYCKDHKEFRVLGTCRLQISISIPFRKLQEKFEMMECNLLQKNFLYSKEEKLNIAACHINEETIKQLDDKILNTYNMFPLLCMMYAALESKPGVRFFEYPLQTIEEQLDKMSEQNECCFIGLALIVIYNNKLYKHLLQNRIDQKFKDVFDDMFEDLGLVNRPSKRSVLSGLKTLEGHYTKELESTITVIHDQIFDILSLYFGKRIPKTILTHGSGTFIAERFLFESVKEHCDELKIVIPSELEHSYLNRMVKEIENNRFYNVFKNVQVHNELYQRKFISFLSKHQSIIQKLFYNRWPLYLSAAKGGKLLVQFILSEKSTNGKSNKQDKDGNHQDVLMDKSETDMYDCSYDSDSKSTSRSNSMYIPRRFRRYNTDDDECTTGEDAYRIKFENSPMVAACEGGYIDIVECLVEYGYNIDRSDTNLPTPLFSACKYGNKEVVDFLLKRNCKVDAVEENGWSALHAACENGNIDIVNNLLKCNSSVNLDDIEGYTPLDVACMNGHTDVVQILLDNYCDIHGSKHIIGVGAIHIACLKGYKDIVEILIKHNVDINQCSKFEALAIYSNLFDRSEALTPIQCACLYGRTDIVKLLLDNNCDVLDNNGFSLALHFACEGGYVDIVDLLLRNNCNINQCHPRANTRPLIVTCEKNKKNKLLQYDIANELNIADFNPNALLYAHENDPTDLVKMLLSNEACDVNIIDCYNRNALHYACSKGQADVVELLLKHHCNVNLNDKWMNTPLFMACESGHVDIVKMLINQYNCMMDVLDVEGNGLLHATCGKSCRSDTFEDYYIRSRLYATKTDRVEIIRFLLGKSCDVNVLNNEGQSVLHTACEYGDTEIVDILLRKNSNVNQCDKAKKTPLFIACESGHVDIVKMLINQDNCMTDVLDVKGNGLLHATYGRYCSNVHYVRNDTDCVEIIRLLLGKSCDVNVLNNEGQSVLHAACEYGDTEIVDILLRKNSNVNQCDKAKKTPLFIACESGHVDIVKMLINQDNCMTDVLDVKGNGLLHATYGRSCSNVHYVRNDTDCVEIIRFLLGKSCDVNVLNNEGQSVLHAACEYGDTEIVDILLRNNSNVNQCDKAKKTPLFIACERGYINIVKLLIESKCEILNHSINGQTVLHAVCSGLDRSHRNYWRVQTFTEDRKDILTLLIDKECDVNKSDNNSQTPLHIASYKGDVALVETLLDNSCVIDQCDDSNKTPFFLACEEGHKDVVKSLMNYNCNMDIRDKIGRSALHAVCTTDYMYPLHDHRGDREDIAELLINKRFGVYDLDNAGQSALHAVCNLKDPGIVKLLLENKLDVDLRDKMGETPIFNACRGCDSDVLKVLIECNCDVNVLNINGLNALNITFDRRLILMVDWDPRLKTNFNKVINLLVDNDCSVNICDADGQTPLHVACSEGYVDIAELFLKRNSNINQCNKFMQTPLILAVEGRHIEVVKLLVENKCDINICDKNGYETCDVNVIDGGNRNALHYACRNGQVDVVELLLKHHCNVNLNDKWMKTPLFMACESGNVDIVKMLINQYNCMMDVLDVEGNGLLHATCGKSCQSDDSIRNRDSRLYVNKNGRVEIIRFLLGKSCDVNVLNNEEQSVLHVACECGDTEIVDILLRNNSDVNQCDWAKKTPLFIACEEGYINIVKLLIESKCEILNHSINGQTVLHAVCSGHDRSHRNYHKDILTLLIDKECDVNKSDNNSQTPLHIASYKGNVALVEILLANNCVVDQCDDSNKTPFFLACEGGHKDVVKSLMNYNCNMDIRDKIGCSALHAVCTTPFMFPLFGYRGDRVDIAERLINKRCGVYDLDDAGQSALHAVCRLDDPGIVKLLLENKLDVDLRDKMGETPIFNACRGYASDVLKVLIEWNCDVNVLNINGLNALNVAFNHRNFFMMDHIPRMKTKFNKVIKLLVDNDCSVNICDADGQTPLHRPCSKGYVDIAELFLKKK